MVDHKSFSCTVGLWNTILPTLYPSLFPPARQAHVPSFLPHADGEKSFFLLTFFPLTEGYEGAFALPPTGCSKAPLDRPEFGMGVPRVG